MPEAKRDTRIRVPDEYIDSVAARAHRAQPVLEHSDDSPSLMDLHMIEWEEDLAKSERP